MLTLFTIPKPFKGHDGIIQTNAIKSWMQTCPECQIIIIGDDEGSAKIADDLGLLHIPEVERSDYGTPLVNSIFNLAQSIAEFPLLCYINADIILLNDFLPAVKRVPNSPLLMVGQRWDLEVNEIIDFKNREWESYLRTYLAEDGQLHPKSGIDYFIYSTGLFGDIPPFAIGRTTWDNWFIYKARLMKATVIDATEVITAIHQNHDYSHDAGGEANVWKGPEALRNQELAGGGEHTLTLDHISWKLTPQGLKKALPARAIYFRLDALLLISPYLRFLRKPIKAVTKLVISIRSILGISK